jgi:hypothetical protein
MTKFGKKGEFGKNGQLSPSPPIFQFETKSVSNFYHQATTNVTAEAKIQNS